MKGRGSCMECYKRIRELREENHLTQKTVSELLPVAEKTYAHYECGRISIPVESLIILAKHYNVSMNYITGVSDERRPFPKA